MTCMSKILGLSVLLMYRVQIGEKRINFTDCDTNFRGGGGGGGGGTFHARCSLSMAGLIGGSWYECV